MPHASPCMPHECPVHTLFTPVHAFCRAHARPVRRACRPSACPMHSPRTLCEHLVHTRCMPHAQPVHNPCTPCKPLRTPYECPEHAPCAPCVSPLLQKDGHQPSLRWSPTILMMATPIQNMVSHLERMVTKLAKDGHQPSSG